MRRCFIIVLFAIFSGCALYPGLFLPVVDDVTLQKLVDEDGAALLRVAESAQTIPHYRIQLVKFPRQDVLGLSFGAHQIFISYELTRRAYEQQSYRWLLRQTLAHEIGHDVLGHASIKSEPASMNAIVRPASGILASDLGLPRLTRFRGYSATLELAADQKAMDYWQKLGWDCHIWVDIFEGFIEQGYYGDAEHPTEERLRQAERVCSW